jgi:PAS domain S-box-containing protein
MTKGKWSFWLRYGLALLAFGLTVALSIALNRYEIKLNLTIPIVLALVVTSWYGGRGPGLLLGVLFQVTTILYTTVPPGALPQMIFLWFSVFSLYVFLAVLISGQRRAQDRLRRQGELLRVTLSSIGDAVIATDIGGKITFMNAAAEKLTGWEAAEAKDRPLADAFRVVNETTREKVENPFDKIRNTGATVAIANHTLLIAKDGREVPIDDSGAPIRDTKGNVIGAIIVFHDVTKRRETERERARLLESETAARLAAERANRQKDDFLATVSHELRTPLNAILGWAAILRREPGSEAAVARAVEVIERNAKTRNELINDILDVSAIVSDRLKIEPVRIDLAAVIGEAGRSLEHAAAAKSIELTARTKAGDVPVMGDAARLRQIFANLISNAVKFTPDGGSVDVSISVDGDEAVVEVRDSGDGIAPEFLTQVFDRFRQIDSSMKRLYGGLGLGLAIVRHLVELHGGNVEADSAGPGLGSVFTVRLPLAAPGVPATAGNGAGRGPDLRGVRVLVVDDHRDSLDLACLSLSRFGAEPQAAESAEEAMRIIERWRPNVILSDLGMPGMDGFDFIARIRSLGNGMANVPAAAVSAYTRDEDRARALAAGYQRHISKPADPADLAAAVAELAASPPVAAA